MFMVVTYPFPAASAYSQLAGSEPLGTAAKDAAGEDNFDPSSSRLEEIVSWTGRERLRLRWYRLSHAISGIYRPSRNDRVRSRG